MAANYTASTITIFLNVVVLSYFWRLNSFLIQKHNAASKNSTSMLHVVTGNAKKMIIKNNTLTMRKLHKSSMCYFHHCSYIGFAVYISDLHECHHLA